MYSPVNTYDYEYIDVDMDDRDSLYYDTISVAGSDGRSISLSRQTIYHSAVDLPDDDHKSPKKKDAVHPTGYQLTYYGTPPNYRNSAPPNSYLSVASDFLDGINGSNQNIMDSNGHGTHDEVSERLIDNINKKLPITTYSQWKARTWRRFQDGERTVDFVLSYNGGDNNPHNCVKRENYELNLEKEGLQLEREKTQKIHFVKIHAPIEVLQRYCEILKIKMPTKKSHEQDSIIQPELQLMQEIKSFCGRPFRFVKLDEEKFPTRDYTLTFEYSRNYDFLFDSDNPNFFDSTTRNMIVNFILERQRFKTEEDKSGNLGIEKLLADGVYSNAYALHDGDCYTAGSQRHLLLSEWASIKKWIKHQPLDNIKEYFGPKIALYFAWLGFYTHMLIPASIVGIICFIYGIVTLSSDTLSNEICKDDNKIIMCPQCDVKCDYWNLKDTCRSSKINYIFDNDTTLFFAIFMSFWAVLYLELWKRYSANLIHRWGLNDFSHQIEHPRPQYLARLQNQQKTTYNYIHKVLEPHVPFWKLKFPSFLMSFSIAILFICLSVIAIFSLIVYRMSQKTAHSIYGNNETMTYKIMVLPITAGLIDLVVISLLDIAYSYLSVYLTDMEYHRTQTSYNESLTIKNYLFQFINYYSSLFYIVFIKGKFVGYPAKYNRIFSFRQEECNPGGCLMELCIQLIIIMMGKQAINAIVEMLIPFLIKTFSKLRVRFGLKMANSIEKLITCNQWTEDYHLLKWTRTSLYQEYLEMVLQFGFTTIFVVAFPLAPVFAMLNNIIEMRLDALKLLKFYQRPVAERIKNIGVWFNIMSIVGKIAVATSAFIIAFNSNLIPKLVYKMTVNSNHNYDGYLDWTLAIFDTKDFENGISPSQSAFSNVTECRYPEFRNPPTEDEKYKRPLIYWRIFTARLAFIVIFQNIVGIIQAFVAWAIPDTPGKLRDKIKREEYLTREIIIEHERKRLLKNQIRTTVTPATPTPNDANITEPKNHNTSNNDDEIIQAHGKTTNMPTILTGQPNFIENGNLINDEMPTYVDELEFRRRRLNPPDYCVDRTTPV